MYPYWNSNYICTMTPLFDPRRDLLPEAAGYFHLNIHKMCSISSSVKSETMDDASTLWRQFHVIYWTNENKAISQQLYSGQQIDELLICHYNSFVTNRDFVVNSQNGVYLLFCFYKMYIGEQMMFVLQCILLCYYRLGSHHQHVVHRWSSGGR